RLDGRERGAGDAHHTPGPGGLGVHGYFSPPRARRISASAARAPARTCRAEGSETSAGGASASTSMAPGTSPAKPAPSAYRGAPSWASPSPAPAAGAAPRRRWPASPISGRSTCRTKRADMSAARDGRNDGDLLAALERRLEPLEEAD